MSPALDGRINHCFQSDKEKDVGKRRGKEEKWDVHTREPGGK